MAINLDVMIDKDTIPIGGVMKRMYIGRGKIQMPVETNIKPLVELNNIVPELVLVEFKVVSKTHKDCVKVSEMIANALKYDGIVDV